MGTSTLLLHPASLKRQRKIFLTVLVLFNLNSRNFFLSGIGFTEGSRKWEVLYILELNQQVYFYLCFCITCMFFMRSVLPYIDLVYKSKFILTCGILR